MFHKLLLRNLVYENSRSLNENMFMHIELAYQLVQIKVLSTTFKSIQFMNKYENVVQNYFLNIPYAVSFCDQTQSIVSSK